MTIRCEERLALAVYRPAAFIYRDHSVMLMEALRPWINHRPSRASCIQASDSKLMGLAPLSLNSLVWLCQFSIENRTDQGRGGTTGPASGKGAAACQGPCS